MIIHKRDCILSYSVVRIGHLFGKVRGEKMILNDAGLMIEQEWLDLTNRFINIKLHEFVVMPNHFYGILEIVAKADGIDLDRSINVLPKMIPTLGDMVGAFQSITTVKYIAAVKTKNRKRFDSKVWQRNYWEHIIRNEKLFIRISSYIKNNPKKWDEDKFYK